MRTPLLLMAAVFAFVLALATSASAQRRSPPRRPVSTLSRRPPGPYQETCRITSWEEPTLTCRCTGGQPGRSVESTLSTPCTEPIFDCGGSLHCGACPGGPPVGPYLSSCRRCAVTDGVLSCTCVLSGPLRRGLGMSQPTLNIASCTAPINFCHDGLRCGECPRWSAGPFSAACRECALTNDAQLTCQCQPPDDRHAPRVSASLDIRACNENLSFCSGQLHCGPCPQVPEGPYRTHCVGCALINNRLSCNCPSEVSRRAVLHETSLDNVSACREPINNCVGQLRCGSCNPLPPEGPYRELCEDCQLNDGQLQCQCRQAGDVSRALARTTLDTRTCSLPIHTWDRQLFCGPQPPPPPWVRPPSGPYEGHCRRCEVQNGSLTCSCSGAPRWGIASTTLRDALSCREGINNCHGILRCGNCPSLPPGPYDGDCWGCVIREDQLSCTCEGWRPTMMERMTSTIAYQTCHQPIHNCNGILRCGPCPPDPPLPSGDYSRACRDCRIFENTLYCDCQNTIRSHPLASLDLRDCRLPVRNCDGRLVCGHCIPQPPYPSGPYTSTCSNCEVIERGGERVFVCDCQTRPGGRTIPASVSYNAQGQLYNCGGTLGYSACPPSDRLPDGSYGDSCHNCRMENDRLTCLCPNPRGPGFVSRSVSGCPAMYDSVTRDGWTVNNCDGRLQCGPCGLGFDPRFTVRRGNLDDYCECTSSQQWYVSSISSLLSRPIADWLGCTCSIAGRPPGDARDTVWVQMDVASCSQPVNYCNGRLVCGPCP